MIARRQEQDGNTLKQCRLFNCGVEYLSNIFKRLPTCREIIPTPIKFSTFSCIRRYSTCFNLTQALPSTALRDKVRHCAGANTMTSTKADSSSKVNPGTLQQVLPKAFPSDHMQSSAPAGTIPHPCRYQQPTSYLWQHDVQQYQTTLAPINGGSKISSNFITAFTTCHRSPQIRSRYSSC